MPQVVVFPKTQLAYLVIKPNAMPAILDGIILNRHIEVHDVVELV
jgi:hypothetical protein